MARVLIGECLDEGQPVTFEYQPTKGEVIIRNGESIVAAVDAFEFQDAINKLAAKI